MSYASADAFGNAIGNSLVRASQSNGTTTTGGGNTSDPLASIGQSISDNVGASVTSSANENAARIAGKVEENGAANIDAVAKAQQAQQNAELDEVIAANQNASAQRASDFVSQSAAYRHHGNILASQSLQARQAAAERIQQSFDAGVARGEANYINGINNRAQVGVDARPLAIAQARYENDVWRQGKENARLFNETLDSVVTSARDGVNYLGRALDKSIYAYGRAFDAYGDAFGRIYDTTLDLWDASRLSEGFTITQGDQYAVTIGDGRVNADIAITPYATFYNVNFAESEINIGKSFSIQYGLSLGRQVLPINPDFGADTTLYFDGGDYKSSLEGTFTAIGVDGTNVNFFGADLEILETNFGGDRPIYAVSGFLGVGGQNLSAHGHMGYGFVTPDRNTTTIKFNEIPGLIAEEAFHWFTYDFFRD